MLKKRKVKQDINFRIDPNIINKFKVLAVQQGKFYSSYVEELIKIEIDKQEKRIKENESLQNKPEI
ncbi:MAG: hypothetical protein WC758_07880 [Candidatus Woesearchaeota archaeon]|jgi:hypothetical protein